MSIEVNIQEEFVDLDLVITVDEDYDYCVHCRILQLRGETTGLEPGRYSIRTVHFMTVRGEEARMSHYKCCAILR